MDLKQPRKRSDVLKEKSNETQRTQMQQAADRHKELVRSANVVAATQEGRTVLRELARLCSFGRTKVVAGMVEKTIDPISTTFNAAQENIYLNIRRHIRREHLMKIEYNLDKEEN